MDKFIKLLLESENTAILPNFGAIVLENESNGALMFNEYLKFNDGKLDNIIIENSNMDLQEAQNYIAKHIREIQAEIDKGNEYSIFELGSFKKDKDGSTVFEGNVKNTNKESDKKQTKEVFAGPSPTPPIKEKEDIPDENSKVEEKKPAVMASEPSKKENKKEEKSKKKENKYEEKKTSVDAKTKPVKKKKEKKTRKKGLVFFLLIFILVIIAGGSTYIGLNYDEFKAMMGWDKFEEVKDPKKMLAEMDEEMKGENSIQIEEDEVPLEDESEELIEETTEDFSESTTEDESEELIEEQETAIEVEKPAPVKEVSSGVSGNYYIIAGTFGEQTNADNLLNELKQKGFPAEIVGFINNMHYVSVQSFSSRSEANNALQNISNDVPKAWVYKKP